MSAFTLLCCTPFFLEAKVVVSHDTVGHRQRLWNLLGWPVRLQELLHVTFSFSTEIIAGKRRDFFMNQPYRWISAPTGFCWFCGIVMVKNVATKMLQQLFLVILLHWNCLNKWMFQVKTGKFLHWAEVCNHLWWRCVCVCVCEDLLCTSLCANQLSNHRRIVFILENRCQNQKFPVGVKLWNSCSKTKFTSI